MDIAELLDVWIERLHTANNPDAWNAHARLAYETGRIVEEMRSALITILRAES